MAAAIQQRAELQRRIWQIANDVRGSVDGWDFKQYVSIKIKPGRFRKAPVVIGHKLICKIIGCIY